MEKVEDYQQIKHRLSDVEWRLDNLYWIINKEGKKVRFVMNWAQRLFFKSMWHLNIILKARQLGFSTFIQIFMLDAALFNSNTSCGVIAHTREDAEEIFSNIVKFAYNSLPVWLQEMRTATQDSARKLTFSNGSSFRVGTSLRSGTFQYLHISEHGKICKKFPDKAKEIKTGALNTVEAGQFIFIESTAEGKEGDFFKFCKMAQDLQRMNKTLTKLDYKFFFFPWWRNPKYAMDPTHVVLTKRQTDYFKKLKQDNKISLTPGQKAWYQKKAEIQGEDMKQEYPSTAKEAFDKVIEGAYYARQFERIRSDVPCRITKVPHQKGIVVDTWWDLGINDMMVIWFTQDVGREFHVIDYYENHDYGFDHYAEYLAQKTKDRGFLYGIHTAPHDIKVRELRGKGVSRKDSAKEAGINFEVAPMMQLNKPMGGIDKTRKLLSISWFDEGYCEKGIIHMENYRREWDDKLGQYKDKPLHNEASHGADGFRTAGVAHIFGKTHGKASAQPKVQTSSRGWT